MGGHLDQPVTELAGGDARHQPSESPAPPAAGGAAACPLAPLGTGLGEVQVFDHDGPRAVLSGGSDDAGDRGPQPSVAGSGGQPGQVQADGGQGTQDVTVGRDDRDGQVPGVDVDRHHRVPPQFLQGRRRCRGGLP